MESHAQMIHNVYHKNHSDVGAFKLVKHSDTVFIYEDSKGNCRVAIRGMLPHSHEDREACLSLIYNRLSSTIRYRKDLNFIKEYNPIKSKTLFLGHSLGGAINDQLMDDGVSEKCITFNPAIQPKDLRNSGNTRYYNPNDFLYILIGRYASNVHVTHTIYSFLNLNFLPNLFSFWTDHKIQQFVGDVDGIIQSVVLNKSAFDSRIRATEWIVRHHYKHSHIIETPNDYRFQQLSPDINRSDKYEVKEVPIGDKGYLVMLYG